MKYTQMNDMVVSGNNQYITVQTRECGLEVFKVVAQTTVCGIVMSSQVFTFMSEEKALRRMNELITKCK